MKLFATLAVVSSSIEAGSILGSGDIKRKITGDWVSQFYSRSRRADVDGAKGFRPLAAMKLYMSGSGQNNKDPATADEFETQLAALTDKYTNYGCYCWINGVEGGVLGGGKTKDVTDHHCKELYRCYKCVSVDYAKNYTDVAYTVDFTKKNGQRTLDCSNNSKQDAENICECDKRFAENIAAAEEACDNGDDADPEWGNHCTANEFKTAKGGGDFVPQDQCDKQFHGHDKENCCGFYPNRYPYDINQNDCCRVTSTLGDIFSIQQKGVCEGAGGDIVVSAEGEPHNYLVQSN
jgi:hypothetical protein